MRYLIINADDFGFSNEVNAAVLRAHKEGVLTSASLMVAESGFEQAVGMARQTPSLGVGLHLVLTNDRPLLPPSDIGKLVDANGNFGADPFLVAWRYYFLKPVQKQLRREMEAQFARFAQTGLDWSHVDGHQHFHIHPVVWDYLLDLCDEYGVHRLRTPREELRAHFKQDSGFRIQDSGRGRGDKETTEAEEEDERRKTEEEAIVKPQRSTLNAQRSTLNRKSFDLNTVASLALRLLGRRNLRVLRKRQTLGGTPVMLCDRVYGQLQTGNMNAHYTLGLLDRLHARTNEIYFHPGTPHARALPPELQSAAVRDVELDALLAPAVRAKIEALGLQTGTYAQIEADCNHR